MQSPSNELVELLDYVDSQLERIDKLEEEISDLRFIINDLKDKVPGSHISSK